MNGDLIGRPGWIPWMQIKANMLGWETRSFERSLFRKRITVGAEWAGSGGIS